MSEETKTKEQLEQEASEAALALAMKKNAENKKRLEEDRKKANHGVTRSYGLKRPK